MVEGELRQRGLTIPQGSPPVGAQWRLGWGKPKGTRLRPWTMASGDVEVAETECHQMGTGNFSNV